MVLQPTAALPARQPGTGAAAVMAMHAGAPPTNTPCVRRPLRHASHRHAAAVAVRLNGGAAANAWGGGEWGVLVRPAPGRVAWQSAGGEAQACGMVRVGCDGRLRAHSPGISTRARMGTSRPAKGGRRSRHRASPACDPRARVAAGPPRAPQPLARNTFLACAHLARALS